MKIRNSIYCTLVCSLALSTSSCIRDEILPCPPLSVRIGVTDKNYFNINEIALEEPVDENLPFAEYITSLRFTLKNIATGEVVEQDDIRDFASGENTFCIDFCDTLPHGTYVLNVFADGRTELPLTFDGTGENLKLHPGSSEGGDTYLTTDTLVYDAWNYDYTVGLERVKGKLLVLMENLPSESVTAKHNVRGLYDAVTPAFRYEGKASVEKSFNVENRNQFISNILLSPSSDSGESFFSLGLYDREGVVLPESQKRAVKIKMKRNELTLLRYTYGNGGGLVISLFVNDHWEEIHKMEID